MRNWNTALPPPTNHEDKTSGLRRVATGTPIKHRILQYRILQNIAGCSNYILQVLQVAVTAELQYRKSSVAATCSTAILQRLAVPRTANTANPTVNVWVQLISVLLGLA